MALGRVLAGFGGGKGLGRVWGRFWEDSGKAFGEDSGRVLGVGILGVLGVFCEGSGRALHSESKPGLRNEACIIGAL